MAENHLLVKVVDTAGVITDVRVNRVVIDADEVNVGLFLSLARQYRLQYCVRYLGRRGAPDHQIATNVDI